MYSVIFFPRPKIVRRQVNHSYRYEFSLISLDLLCVLFLFSCGIQVQIFIRLHLPAVELQSVIMVTI